MADLKTTSGGGPMAESRLDWLRNPPLALLDLRRAEIAHSRRIVVAKLIGAAVLIACSLAILVLSFPHVGAAAILVAWGVRWLVPQIGSARALTRELAEIDARPKLPTAHLVVRTR